MPEKMSYYSQLVKKFKLLDWMDIYKTDLTVHAKKHLAKATAFIGGARKSGFNEIIYDDLISDCTEKRAIDYSQCEEYDEPSPLDALGMNNERFFVGYEGVVEEVTREQALKVYKKWLAEAKAKPESSVAGKPGLYWIVLRTLKREIYNYMYNTLQGEDPGNLISEIGLWETTGSGNLEKSDKIYADIIKRYLKKRYNRGLRSIYSIHEQKELLQELRMPISLDKLLRESIHEVINDVKRLRTKYFE